MVATYTVSILRTDYNPSPCVKVLGYNIGLNLRLLVTFFKKLAVNHKLGSVEKVSKST